MRQVENSKKKSNTVEVNEKKGELFQTERLNLGMKQIYVYENN